MHIETVGDLIDLLEEHRQLVQDVKEAERSVAHGGSNETMRGKRETLAMYESFLDDFRNRPVTFQSAREG